MGKKFLPVAKKAYSVYGPCLFLQPHLVHSLLCLLLPVTQQYPVNTKLSPQSLCLSLPRMLFLLVLHGCISLLLQICFNITSSKKKVFLTILENSLSTQSSLQEEEQYPTDFLLCTDHKLKLPFYYLLYVSLSHSNVSLMKAETT